MTDERSETVRNPEGVDRLAVALYGRKAQPHDYIGGSDANIFHAAAERITELERQLEQAQARTQQEWRICELVRKDLEEEFQRRTELERQLERANDLIRSERHALHDEGLITDDEFAALAADSEQGKRVARLEGYDAIRRQLAEAQEFHEAAAYGAESFLAQTGFSDSRAHSATAIARLMEDYAQLKLAASEQARVVAERALLLTIRSLRVPAQPPETAIYEHAIQEAARQLASESKERTA